MSVLMLADTTKEAGGTGLDRRSTSGSAAGELIRDIRAAFSEFTKQMLDRNAQSELALMEFGQASIMVTNFTSSGEEIEKGISKLIPKPSAALRLPLSGTRAGSSERRTPERIRW